MGSNTAPSDLGYETRTETISGPITTPRSYIGKQPSDYHIWIQAGVPPVFVREEGPLYEGGPIWRIEQVSPSFQ